MKNFDVENVAESIGQDILMMTIGKVSESNGDENSLSKDLAIFTTGDDRHATNRVAWKDGNSRYPHINRVTGTVGLYENPDVQELAKSVEIAEYFASLYSSAIGGNVERKDMVHTHGPPIPIVKPQNSGKSCGINFAMQNTSVGLKINGLLCLTDNDGERTGEIQKLQNFDIYYDVLDQYYEFQQHAKDGVIY
ncbi:MAG: hypothetical protein JRZ94_06015, partial [Nitrososphaerota archaeon]|nr:hypothetical protein [Nitrososphaerota archaeon]